MIIYWPHLKNQRQCKLKCEFLDCVFGLGLAGRGYCPGAWWMQCCPEYMTEDKFENILKDLRMISIY
jgi:hypothetical protein